MGVPARRYPQIRLDAFGLLPNFIHGIIVFDVARQRTFKRPRSIPKSKWKNMHYSFVEVVRGLQTATCSIHPGSLHRGSSFYSIADDLTLERTRVLIWQGPSKWDSTQKNVSDMGWPTLKYVRPMITNLLVHDTAASRAQFVVSRTVMDQNPVVITENSVRI